MELPAFESVAEALDSIISACEGARPPDGDGGPKLKPSTKARGTPAFCIRELLDSDRMPVQLKRQFLVDKRYAADKIYDGTSSFSVLLQQFYEKDAWSEYWGRQRGDYKQKFGFIMCGNGTGLQGGNDGQLIVAAPPTNHNDIRFLNHLVSNMTSISGSSGPTYHVHNYNYNNVGNSTTNNHTNTTTTDSNGNVQAIQAIRVATDEILVATREIIKKQDNINESVVRFTTEQKPSRPQLSETDNGIVSPSVTRILFKDEEGVGPQLNDGSVSNEIINSHASFEKFEPLDNHSSSYGYGLLERNEHFISELFDSVSNNGNIHSPERTIRLDDVQDYLREGEYSHPVAVFGQVSSFINAIMSDSQTIKFGSMVLVTAEQKCFIVCVDNGNDEENVANDLWISTAAPSLGYRVSHDITGVLDNGTSFTFHVATEEVMQASKPIEDILVTLANHMNIKEIGVESSVSATTTAVPITITCLKSVLSKSQLTFKLEKATVTFEQQMHFASSAASLVFVSCTFEADGEPLLGSEFDPRKSRPTMHVVFRSCMPGFLNVLKAANTGWFKYIGLAYQSFDANHVDFLQELNDASLERDFEFQLLSDITLTLGPTKYLVGNIRKWLKGDQSMQSIIREFKKSSEPTNTNEETAVVDIVAAVAGQSFKDVNPDTSLVAVESFQATLTYKEQVQKLEREVQEHVPPNKQGNPCQHCLANFTNKAAGKGAKLFCHFHGPKMTTDTRGETE